MNTLSPGEKRARALAIKDRVLEDIKSQKFTNKELCEKWGLVSGTIGQWSKKLGVTLPQHKHGPDASHWEDKDKWIGVFTDLDIAKKFGITSCSVRARRNKLKIPAVPRDHFLSEEYRYQVADWLDVPREEREPMLKWKVSDEFRAFIHDLRRQKIRERINVSV